MNEVLLSFYESLFVQSHVCKGVITRANQVSQTCNLNAKHFEIFKIILANPAQIFHQKVCETQFQV